jgi:pSer/pThr/pTyr-binding forkhead associated (FHA) protein
MDQRTLPPSNVPGAGDSLAKITWVDPTTNDKREFILVEGATASIGRSPDNDICIPERHVSRQHAVISYRDGVFVITDLGSANRTFVNDKMIADSFPLAHGDIIRLYVPVLNFSATATQDEVDIARTTGRIIIPSNYKEPPRLRVSAGPGEGQEFVLTKDVMTLGRMTADAHWDVILQDRSVSRPHCRFHRTDEGWTVMDLGSANKTFVNKEEILGVPRLLKDGDVLILGETTLLFRQA